MSHLLVEIGNTALKAVWADAATLSRMFRYQGEDMAGFILSLMEKECPDVLLVASAAGLPEEQENRLRACCSTYLPLDSRNPGLLSAYGLPADLPADRAAAVKAARHLFEGKGTLLFDFGTMLSVDLVEPDGSYGGGFLSPGLTTRFKAVNRYSRTLPLLRADDEIPSVGYSVQDAVQAGVVSGILFEIQGYLSRFPEKTPVFTGGDALYFAKKMKNPIFVVCNLVLTGLALIAEDYVQRKD